MAICIKCGNEIPTGRLKAVPNTKTCVNCSSSERVAGFRVISGKDTYSEIQIVSQDTWQKLTSMQERKGQSPSSGVKFKE